MASVLDFFNVISEATQLNDFFVDHKLTHLELQIFHCTLYLFFAAQWLDNKTQSHDVQYINRAPFATL